MFTLNVETQRKAVLRCFIKVEVELTVIAVWRPLTSGMTSCAYWCHIPKKRAAKLTDATILFASKANVTGVRGYDDLKDGRTFVLLDSIRLFSFESKLNAT